MTRKHTKLSIEEMPEDMRKSVLGDILMGPVNVFIGHRMQLILDQAVSYMIVREKEAYNRGYGDGLTGREPTQ